MILVFDPKTPVWFSIERESYGFGVKSIVSS